jgi:hypothetical protein
MLMVASRITESLQTSQDDDDDDDDDGISAPVSFSAAMAARRAAVAQRGLGSIGLFKRMALEEELQAVRKLAEEIQGALPGPCQEWRVMSGPEPEPHAHLAHALAAACHLAAAGACSLTCS